MVNLILPKRGNHIKAKGGKFNLAKRVKVQWLFQGALKGILPTEILENDSVLTIIKNHKESFKDLLVSTSDADKTEHLAKLKALTNSKYSNDTNIVDLAKFVGVE